MTSTPEKDNNLQLIKIIVIFAFGLAAIFTRTTLGFILGVLLLVIGIQDVRTLRSARPQRAEQPRREGAEPASREDGLRITDLSSAKEVDYQKDEGSHPKA